RPATIPGQSPRTSSPVFTNPFSAVTQLVFSTDATGDGVLLDAGRYVLALSVSDPLGATDVKLVNILALDPKNVVPSANAGLDRAVIVTHPTSGSPDILQDIPDVLGRRPVAFI